MNLNITDAEVRDLKGPAIKAQIAAISGQPERKIATVSDGLRTLERLRQWARNQDGLLGIPKDTQPVVRSFAELQAKAAAKGRALEQLPKAFERVTPIDPEWDDPEEIVDGNDAIGQLTAHEQSAQDHPFIVPDPAPLVTDEIRHPAEGDPGTVLDEGLKADADAKLAPWDRDTCKAPTVAPAPAPDTVASVEGITVKVGDEEITHPRGTLRARLARQALETQPIELQQSALRDRRSKKEQGLPRKVREPMIAVRATFAGLSKCHVGSLRANVLAFIQSLAKRETPGWPVGTVLPAEVDAFFKEDCKMILHKLIQDNHLTRSTPLIPERPVAKKAEAQTESA